MTFLEEPKRRYMHRAANTYTIPAFPLKGGENSTYFGVVVLA